MISIVVPAYNEERYIGNCIESLVQQKTTQKFEVIIVDNNSTDKTSSIAQSYKHALNLRVVKEKEQGIVPARNRGFNEAKGEIIARIDADSIASRNWVEQIHKNFSSHNIVALAGTFLAHDIEGFFKTPRFVRYFYKFIYGLAGQTMLFGFNGAFKRSAWETIKNEAENVLPFMHEDFDLSIKLTQVGKIRFDKNLVVKTSARRFIGNKFSFLVVYPLMSLYTFIYGYIYRLSH